MYRNTNEKELGIGKIMRINDDGSLQIAINGVVHNARLVQSYGFASMPTDDHVVQELYPHGNIADAQTMQVYDREKPLQLASGEVALYSMHKQYIICANTGELELFAPKPIAIATEQEDLYSILDDLITAIQNIKTAQFSITVNGSAPSGACSASGMHLGVDISPGSKNKLNEITQRLKKLLKKKSKHEWSENKA